MKLKKALDNIAEYMLLQNTEKNVANDIYLINECTTP